MLDPNNTSVYKQLYRAAKAKGKLRLKATVKPNKEPVIPKPASVEDDMPNLVSIEEPVVPSYAQTPFWQLPLRNSNAASQTEVGARTDEEVKADTLKIQSTTEVPVTHFLASGQVKHEPIVKSAESTARDKWFAELAAIGSHARQAVDASAMTIVNYSVYCNACDGAIPDEHYHCSTCDDGDFDLCQTCIDNGVACGGEDHWMIKRFVKSGKVINSTTETLPPKKKSNPAASVPGVTVSWVSPPATTIEDKIVPGRICNSCVQGKFVFLAHRKSTDKEIEFDDAEFVSCTTCEDFDLCIPCHTAVEHGHNPKHAFVPATKETNLDFVARTLLAPGRNASHNALCDGCDKFIYGIRHKCLDCPDWDYCSTCVLDASFIHPSHRFVPIYESLGEPSARSQTSGSRHYGVYCDGPLCSMHGPHGSYINGDRYKCAVCPDVDFCARCEASPSNPHNRTHPLIKFKTPVRDVNVTTLADHHDGQSVRVGDRCPRHIPRHIPTRTTAGVSPTESANAATQVHTVADLQPCEVKEETKEVKKEVTEEVKELPVVEKDEEMVAHFVRDSITDGTAFAKGASFSQTWYLRNTGDVAWPAGCDVRFVGGDVMFAIDPAQPASVAELYTAAKSNECKVEVLPGQEIGFTVPMKAPTHRLGSFISYWRLTGPDGKKFGHKLWCEIAVSDEKSAVSEVESAVDEKQEATSDQAAWKAKMVTKIDELWKTTAAEQAKTANLKLSPEDNALTARMNEKINELWDGNADMYKAKAAAAAAAAAKAADSVNAVFAKLRLDETVKTAEAEQAWVGKKIEEAWNVAQLQATKTDSTAVEPLLQAFTKKIDELTPSAAPANTEVEVETESQGSQMIFPKLDKESPVMSVTEDGSASNAAFHNPYEVDDFDEFTEEPLDDSSESGFMTDEEYDILDASDEEYLDVAKEANKK